MGAIDNFIAPKTTLDAELSKFIADGKRLKVVKTQAEVEKTALAFYLSKQSYEGKDTANLTI